jgi:hypothetical protein
MPLVTRQYGPDAKFSKLSFYDMDMNLYYLQELGVSGFSYSNGTINITNPTGGTKSVTINKVTGFTYDNLNTFTITDNYNNNFNATINTVTGLTVNGTISATTYQNLPTDIRVTGGTYSNGTAIFTNNTGGTFNVTGFTTGNTFTTGTTISGNVVEFNRTDAQNAYDVNLSGITYTNIITSPTQIASNVNTTNDYLGITGSVILSDEASNYGGIWNNGSNQGTGFNPWAIITQPNTGVFIGNPASDGMLTAGIGTTAFGLFCNSTPNSVNASRPFTSPLEVGDVFSFYWAVNFDGTPNGNKGFDLKAGGSLIFNADIAASSSILSNLPSPYNVIDSGYGITPMLVTLTRTTNTQYTITITSRSGSPTYSAPINSSLGIDEVNFYNVEQPDSLGQRNLYFNKLEIIKAASLNKISVGDLGNLIGGDYLPLSGGTVSGTTNFTNGLSANTISATTTNTNTLNVDITGYVYIGDVNVDNSWRYYISGNDLVFERRIGGVWTNKMTITG